ncbi:hypothetical protein NLU13_9457 [Sarocladium strictum]|uniref:2Fe-2S ferredoxin-type domain-containing protein n=1 Tax=Sarocladium strictum TaxID=5046 RepID=A0AA39GAM2_SARSR|nr:hypothetical protein NLU13_9457 [Sarocladium strictum]
MSRSLATSLARLPRLASRANPLPQSRFSSSSLSPRSLVASTSRRACPTQLGHAARRAFTTSTSRRHGHIDPPKPGEELYVTFIDKEGDEHKFAVKEGDNLLDIAQANDLEMEGACGGSCACSTCHVIVSEEDYYDQIPEPEDDENDMLDLAFGLTETSRLGCQVKMTKELDGLVVKLPSMTRNLQASDFGS